MPRKSTALLLAAAALLWSSAALADCAGYISDFRKTVNADRKAGKLDASTYSNINTEVDRIDKLCRDDQQGRALKVLLTTKERYGYKPY
jgi:hypothetical protein